MWVRVRVRVMVGVTLSFVDTKLFIIMKCIMTCNCGVFHDQKHISIFFSGTAKNIATNPIVRLCWCETLVISFAPAQNTAIAELQGLRF